MRRRVPVSAVGEGMARAGVTRGDGDVAGADDVRDAEAQGADADNLSGARRQRGVGPQCRGACRFGSHLKPTTA